jgi:hypothetical protein
MTKVCIIMNEWACSFRAKVLQKSIKSHSRRDEMKKPLRLLECSVFVIKLTNHALFLPNFYDTGLLLRNLSLCS